MAERTELKVVKDGAKAEIDQLSPRNGISVTLSGSSADLFESYRGSSNCSDAIVGSLFMLITAIRVSTLDLGYEGQAFVRQLVDADVVVVGVQPPPSWGDIVRNCLATNGRT